MKYSWFPADAAAQWRSSPKRKNTWWRRLGPSSCFQGWKRETGWWNQYWRNCVSVWARSHLREVRVQLWMHECLHTDDGMEAETSEQLSISLAKASPEVKKCVASCKRIAESTKQQNSFQNVRSTFYLFSLYLNKHHFKSVLNSGEWRVVPGGPGDWQGLFYCHGICVFYRHHLDLPDGVFQPASRHTFPRRCQDVSATT